MKEITLNVIKSKNVKKIKKEDKQHRKAFI